MAQIRAAHTDPARSQLTPLPAALAAMLVVALIAQPSPAQSRKAADKPPATYSSLPSEIPASFEPLTSGLDYVRRLVMIPMRDGVKLHTVILVPRGAKGAPILLTRTPYDADGLTTHAESSHLASVLEGYDNATDVIVEGGYIRVVQDVRGKHGSEGDYVMNRPPRGPQNPTPVDHSTDTYDTIEWLVKNVPESNGRVGIIGISYDGFLPLMALIEPASGAEGLRADESDGRRMDGRRLVPQRRVPSDQSAVHVQPGSDAEERRQMVGDALRRLRRLSEGRNRG